MYRIMLVDDEPNILSALRRALSKLVPEELDGERPIIEPYSTAAEALKRAGEARFDLVISDFRMPEINGVEFLKFMVDLQPDVARIVLSGYTELDSVIEAVNEIQILRYMTKPWNDAELRLVVRQGLAQRAVALENQRLADLVRAQQREILRQRAELRRLEAQSPGITQLHISDDGGIVLSEADHSDDLSFHEDEAKGRG
jgi:YesN/AraC family two-component response regulator